MREIDTEHNWFWREGYKDGLDGSLPIVPDEVRRDFQRGDYFAGYAAGQDDYAARAEAQTQEPKPRNPPTPTMSGFYQFISTTWWRKI